MSFQCSLPNPRPIPILISAFGCLVALAACSAARPQDSTGKITNGLLDLGDTGVLLIQSVTPSTGQKHICTSVLIRPDLLVTAAHCVKERDTQEQRSVQLALPNAPKIKKVKIHPKYESKSKSRFDVALLSLDRPLVDKLPISLAKKPPKKGDQVRLVGFGDNQHAQPPENSSGGGIKRTGYATISVIDDHFIYSRGIRDAKHQNASRPTGADSAAAHGDSGGPLLNLEGELLGIACAVMTSSQAADIVGERPLMNAFTQVDAIRDFITDENR